MPDSLLFEIIEGFIDSLTVVLDKLWWMNVLGPDGDSVKCVTMEVVGCSKCVREEVVCGVTDIDTAVGDV